MRVTIKQCLVLCLTLVSWSASASRIVSTCRTEHTQFSEGSGNLSYDLQYLAAYKQNFTALKNILNEVGVWGGRLPFMPAKKPTTQQLEDLQALSRRVDDLQLLLQGNFLDTKYASKPDCVSTKQWIEPQATQFRRGSKREDFRLRFKICEYADDGQRQIPIEESCRYVGEARGEQNPRTYSIAAIDRRYERINESVKYFESRAKMYYWVFGGGSALVSAAFGRALISRAVIGVGLPTLLKGAVTLGTAGLAAKGYYDHIGPYLLEPFGDLVDLRDAAATAVNGHIGTVVKVDMPIEVFEVILSEYLNTIIPEDDAPQVMGSHSTP